MPADPRAPALDELLSHAAWVRALARSLVGDAASAEDVVQETWLAALRRPPRHGANPRGWLATVVRNAVRQRGRGAARRTDREERRTRSEPAVPSADDLADRVETQRHLAARMLELDEPYRATLLLRYYEGLSAAEIARRTEVPAGTVRWRLAQGLEQLRGRLDDDFGGERSAWVALLWPLAERDVALASTAATGAGLLKGILTMKLGLKPTLGGILVAALVFGPPGGALRGYLAGGDRLDDTPLPVTFRPWIAAADSGPTATAASGDERSAVTGDPAEATPVPVPTTGIRARLVDPDGNPVAGGRLEIRGYPKAAGRSDAEGFASAWVPAGQEPWNLGSGARVDHPNFAPLTLEMVLVPDQRVELGDVVLTPAGAVEGQVVDAGGQPLPDAWVALESHPGESGEWLRRERLERSAHPDRYEPCTDEAGRFRLERLPQGMVRLWAGRKGHEAALSPPVEVRGGMVSGEVRLVLGTLDPNDFLTGQVVDPEGKPVAGASVEHEYRSMWRGSGSGSFHADAEGRFTLALPRGLTRDLRAVDRERRYAAARAEGIGGGEHVVLQLTVKEHLSLTVRSASGELGEVAVWGYNADHTDVLVRGNEVRGNGNIRLVPLPNEPFLLEVEAPGHERRSLGPFDGLAAPRELEVELRALPGVHGRVRAHGSPLAGAAIAFFRAAERRTIHNGFAVRVDPYPRGRTESDAEGSFVATLREAGRYYLRVSAAGLAPAELGPFDIDPARGLTDLEVELTPGGSLEGRVFGGEDGVAGRIVALSRGDGHALTRRTGADGSYRFEHLTPGPWLVRLVDGEISPNSSTTAQDSSPFDEAALVFNCAVVEGQTTWHDLSLDPAAGHALVGSFLLDGEPAAGWIARLSLPGGRVVAADAALEATVAADGSLRIAAPSSGIYDLTLRHPARYHRALRTTLQVGPGDTPWHADLATGQVRLRGVRPVHESGAPLDFLLGEGDGLQLVLGLIPGEDGDEVLERIPVLPCSLVRYTIEELAMEKGFGQGGTPLLEVVPIAGGTVEVTVP